MYSDLKNNDKNKTQSKRMLMIQRRSSGKSDRVNANIKIGNTPKYYYNLQNQANMKNDNEKGLVAQLTKIIVLQNTLTEEEKDDIYAYAHKESAEVILDWDREQAEPVTANEKVLLVAHGNTDVMGDEEQVTNRGGKRLDIDFAPAQIAKLLSLLLPANYRGLIEFWVCDGATKPSKKPSMVERILEQFQKLRRYEFEGKMVGYPGAVSSDMVNNPTVTIGNQEYVPADNRKEFSRTNKKARKMVDSKTLDKKALERNKRLLPKRGAAKSVRKKSLNRFERISKERMLKRAGGIVSDDEI